MRRRAPVFSSTVAAMPEVSGWSTPSTEIVETSGSRTTANTRFWVRSPPAKPVVFDGRVGSPSMALASGAGIASLAIRFTRALIDP